MLPPLTTSASSSSSTPSVAVAGMPIATRVLTLWLPFTYFLCLIGPGSSSGHSLVLKYFSLIPANTFLVHSYPWTFVTHVFVENNGFLLALSLASLATMGRKLEEEWGTRKFLLLILLAAISSSLAIVVNTAVAYGLFGSMALFEYFAGFLPCSMALVVGYWQRCPDDPLSMVFSFAGGDGGMALPLPSGEGGGQSSSSSSSSLALGSTLRVRHVPFLCFTGLLIYEFLFGPKTLKEEDIVPGEDDLFPGSDTYPALCALWWCWFVLRFCLLSVRSMSVDSGLCGLGYAGDPNPNFALHMSIPIRALQLFFQHSVSTVGFRILLMIGLGSAVQEYDPNARFNTSSSTATNRNASGIGGIGGAMTNFSSSSVAGKSTTIGSSSSATISIHSGSTAGAASSATPPPPIQQSSSGTTLGPASSSTGGASAPLSEADRRRQIAMQALQSRLSSRQQQQQAQSRGATNATPPAATPPVATSTSEGISSNESKDPQQRIV